MLKLSHFWPATSFICYLLIETILLGMTPMQVFVKIRLNRTGIQATSHFRSFYVFRDEKNPLEILSVNSVLFVKFVNNIYRLKCFIPIIN